MAKTLGLLGGGGGTSCGGRVAVKDVGMSSEVLSYQKEAELELGLGLSLCGGGSGGVKSKVSPWGGRILTAEDFPSGFSGKNSASATGGGVTGTKRAADCFGPPEVGSPPAGVSQVVGWPPIRTYRMNSLVNQAKALNSDGEKGVGGNDGKDMNKKNKNDATPQEKGHLGFVKVNMDGLPIGRKVDLNAHACYETLAQTLEDMFFKPTKTIGSICGGKERVAQTKLLDGLSEFVLTYEDKEGDWMLVGDVPWGMFLSTVRRLRIMRTSEANGLGSRFQGRKNDKQKAKPI